MTTFTTTQNQGSTTKPCEDRVGHLGSAERMAGWVIDGATGMGDRQYVTGPGNTDAAWYAEKFAAHLHDAIAAHSGDCDSTAIAAKAIAGVRDDFKAQAQSTTGIPLYAQPSAAGIWFTYSPATRMLSWAGLGDCVGLIETPSGEIKRLPISWDRDKPDAYLKPLLEAYGMVNPNASDEERRADLLPLLRRARSNMNKPGGYWIYGLAPEAAQHQVMGREQLAPGDYKILLMSDGFERLCAFGLYDDKSICAKAGHGLAALVAELRQAENSDPACVRYPRTKKSDDATALVAKFTVG